MAVKFKDTININGEYTFPLEDGTAGQTLQTDGSGNISFSTIGETVKIACKNTSGSTITKGTPVYVTGTVGASFEVEIAPADASDSAKMPAVGLLETDLANNGEGYVVTGGLLKNLTTDPIDGTNTASNDTIYVKAGGGLTMTKPTGSDLIQNIGKVGRVNTANAGSIVVSSILRTNDIPNLTEGKIWVGSANNTIESTVVHIDEANARVGIGTASPSNDLEIASNIPTIRLTDNATGNPYHTISGTGNGDVTISVDAGNSGPLNSNFIVEVDTVQRFNIAHDGDIAFNTDDLFIDGVNNRVGIGTTSPTVPLEVEGELRVNSATARLVNSGGESKFIIDSATDSDAIIQFKESGGNRFTIGVDGSDGDKFKFGVSSDLTTTTALTIDSSGRVGIGVSPSTELHLKKDSNVRLRLETNNTGTSTLQFADSDDGNVGIIQYDHNVDAMIFDVNASERMRIDSSGVTTFSGPIISEGPDGGMVMREWTAGSTYGMIGTANMSGQEYSLLTNGTDTFIGSGSGGGTYIRGGANDSSPEMLFDGSQVLVKSNGADTLFGIQGNSTGQYDPILNFLATNSPITTEGAQIWYDNSVGDLHISTTYANDAADIHFYTRTGADKGTSNERLNIGGNGAVTALVDMRAPIFYDSDATTYYINPAGTSVQSFIKIYSQTPHLAIEDSNNGAGGGAQGIITFRNTVGKAIGIGYTANETSNSDLIISTNAASTYGGYLGLDAIAIADSQADIILDPKTDIRAYGNLTFGTPGGGQNTNGRFLSIEGNADAGGEGSSRIFFAEHNSTTSSMDNYGMSIAYRGGATSITGASGNSISINALGNGYWGLFGHNNSINGNLAMFGFRDGSYVQATGSFRAPIFYDSSNTAYYSNQASTSRFNTLNTYGPIMSGDTYTDPDVVFAIHEYDTDQSVRDKLKTTSTNVTREVDGTAPAGGCFQVSGPLNTEQFTPYYKIDDNQEYTFEVWIKWISGTDNDSRLYAGSRFYDSSRTYLGNSQRYWASPGTQFDANTNNSGWYHVSGTLGPSRGSSNGNIPTSAEYMRLLFLFNYLGGDTVTRYCGLKVFKSDKTITSLYRKSLVTQFGTSENRSLVIDNNGDIYGTKFIDANSSTYFMDMQGGGKLTGNFEFASNTTSTSYQYASIELRESNYTGNATATPPFIGFHWGGVVASSISIESNGTIAIRDNPGTGYEDFKAAIMTSTVDMRAPIFYDSGATSYYADFASLSNLNQVNMNGRSSMMYAVSDLNSVNGNVGVTGFKGNFQATNRPGTGNYATGIEFTYHDSSARTQLAAASSGSNNTGELWVRSEAWSTSSWSSWWKLWHQGNDGAGSGLDADLLDGWQTISGGDYWGGIPIVGTDGVMEIGRYIDFHQTDGSTNDYAIRMDATTARLVISGGYTESAESMRAPLFYDSNNTGYYVDPAGTSNIHSYNRGLAEVAGWVPAYSNSDKNTVRWNTTEDATELQSSSDSSTGAAHRAIRVEAGHTYRWTINLKGNVASTAGLYIRNYLYTGNLPNGKTHVSNSASYTFVQEDSTGTLGWGVENAAVPSSWTTYEKEFTATADGYMSMVVLNWTSHGNNSIYLKTPDVQKISDAGASTYTNLYYATDTNYGLVGNDCFFDTINSGLTTDPLELVYSRGTEVRIGANGGDKAIKAASFYDGIATSYYADFGNTGDSIRAAGDIVAYYSSDKRLKDNIIKIDSALDKVNAIGGYTFEWNEVSHKETGKKDVGVIAQEVEEIFPEIVQTRSNGYKAVNYEKLVPLLIEAVKELSEKVKMLENK